MKFIFWISILGILYAYLGYPIILIIVNKLSSRISDKEFNTSDYVPTVSIIIPVHNEEQTIADKLKNTLSLDYPGDKAEIIIVSDGSSDKTNDIVQKYLNANLRLLSLPQRSGKNAALNRGLEEANNDIVVFSDASIMLDKLALKNIVKRFQHKEIGCISGEDHIQDSGGEGLYGRYELFLRNLESTAHSIVGASGSFYAQRRHLCRPFNDGMAPDFLSVLQTVESGYLAISVPDAFGIMTSLKNNKDEFNRKVRTLVRGMTTLYYKKNLLNIFKFSTFSIILFSHKLMRWFVPFFMILLFVSNLSFLDRQPYVGLLILQFIFYLLTIISLSKYKNVHKKLFGRIPLYFSTVNAAILFAWYKYIIGVRQDIWSPTKR